MEPVIIPLPNGDTVILHFDDQGIWYEQYDQSGNLKDYGELRPPKLVAEADTGNDAEPDDDWPRDDEDSTDDDEAEQSTPLPDGDGNDDRNGVVRRFPGDLPAKDPFEVPDFSSKPQFAGGSAPIEPWDRYDGLSPRTKYYGGSEPVSPEEKIGPKFRPTSSRIGRADLYYAIARQLARLTRLRR